VQCLTKQGKHEEAAGFLADLSGEDKSSPEVLYELAWARKNCKLNDKAITAYKQLIEKYPDHKLCISARAELADMLYTEKKYEESAKMCRLVVEDKKSSDALRTSSQYRLAWCLYNLKKYDEAAGEFLDFGKKYPKNDNAPGALYQASVCLVGVPKVNEAIAALNMLLKNYPDHKLAKGSMIRLGQLHNDQGSGEKAVEKFAAFLGKYPEDKLSYLAEFGMGRANELAKKYQVARKHYANVIKTHNGPTAARSQFRMGEMWMAENKLQEAVKAFITVYSVYDFPEWSAKAMLESGRVFEAMKNTAQARKQYEMCVEKYPDTEEGRQAKEKLSKLGK